MIKFLDKYTLRLVTKGPVHIGSGQKLNKKEYLFLTDEKKVLVPDLYKMYRLFEEKGLEEAYEDYMLTCSWDLYKFLIKNGIGKNDFRNFSQYMIDIGDALDPLRSRKEINTFVKDGHGRAYIPGSSVKGAIRTALLAADLIKNNELYDEGKKDVFNSHVERGKRYLKNESSRLEARFFSTLKIDVKNDQVKDILRGIRIADSPPISYEDMILTAKIDYSVKGNENPINSLNECIRPETSIDIQISFDKYIYEGGWKLITEALQIFQEGYYDYFSSKFPGGSDLKEGNYMFLGGGTGYVSKTVMYPLLGKKQALKKVSRLLEENFRQHNHHKDVEIGVSPHMLKCTSYRNELLDMGLCSISFVEE